MRGVALETLLALCEASDSLYLLPAAAFGAGSDAFVVQREFCDPLTGFPFSNAPPQLFAEAETRLRFLLRLVHYLLLSQVRCLYYQFSYSM